jgi:hypothetical protein
MQGQGPGNGQPPFESGYQPTRPVGTRRVADVARVGDEEFMRERERQYLLSVRAATAEVLRSSGWTSEQEAYRALAAALERRGIDPDPEAVRSGAALISRGRRPRILDLDLDRKAGGGRRRR